MSIKKLKRVQTIQMKKQGRKDFNLRMRKCDQMIRYLDQAIPKIKEYNQKNPADAILVPCSSISKSMV